MEDSDAIKAWNEAVLKKAMNEAPPEALETASEVPDPISPESISACLPPEGQAWLNGLNPFCRRAVEHDFRSAGPHLFVAYWKSLRDTLEKLEREFGPSDHWKYARDRILAAFTV
jgi:hypothetical protein